MTLHLQNSIRDGGQILIAGSEVQADQVARLKRLGAKVVDTADSQEIRVAVENALSAFRRGASNFELEQIMVSAVVPATPSTPVVEVDLGDAPGSFSLDFSESRYVSINIVQISTMLGFGIPDTGDEIAYYQCKFINPDDFTLTLPIQSAGVRYVGQAAPTIAGTCIMNIYRDSQGVLWIQTGLNF